jgi:hypothetical protein
MAKKTTPSAKGKVKSSSVSVAGGWGVKGGSGHMYGKQGADPMASGQTAVTAGDTGGKWAKGGKGKMFGFTGSKASKAGVTK